MSSINNKIDQKIDEIKNMLNIPKFGIDRYGDKLRKEKGYFGFDRLVDEYKTKVKDCLTDIISREEGISEKSFSEYDKIYDRIRDIFSRKTKINCVVNEFEKKGYRPEYCAEAIYAEFYIF